MVVTYSTGMNSQNKGQARRSPDLNLTYINVTLIRYESTGRGDQSWTVFVGPPPPPLSCERQDEQNLLGSRLGDGLNVVAPYCRGDGLPVDHHLKLCVE